MAINNSNSGEYDFLKEYNKLREFFNSYKTDESKSRIKHLNDYAAKNKDVALCAYGSLSFGMSEQDSDIDAIIIAEDSADISGIPYADKLSIAAVYRMSGIEQMIEGASRAVSGEFCRKLLSRKPNEELDCSASKDDTVFMELAKLYSSMHSSEVINRAMARRISDKINSHVGLASALDLILRENKSAYFIPSCLRHSFGKYSERLNRRGIDLPHEVSDSLSALVSKSAGMENISYEGELEF